MVGPERVRAEKGFVMVEPPEDKSGFIETELSQMMGRPLRPEDISYAQTMNRLARIFEIPSSKFEQYVAFDPAPHIGNNGRKRRRYAERGQRFLQLMETLNMENMNGLSFGTFLPTYLAVMDEYRKRKHIKAADVVSTLLVGAYTVDTVKEYNAGVKYIFPNANPHIIDIEGEETGTRLSVYGDGTKMPFKDNGFDMVMTNALLYMLEDPKEPERLPREIRSVLFRELFRVLKPGGMVCLVEANLEEILGSEDVEKCFDELSWELESAGFVGIVAEPTVAYRKRIDLYKFLRANGKGLCINPDDLCFIDDVLTLTAIKPDTQYVLQRLKGLFDEKLSPKKRSSEATLRK